MPVKYNRKLFSNFIYLSLVQGINFLIPLLVMPYVISKVGVDGIGVIAIAQTVMIYLTTITDYSFNISATKDIVLNRNDNTKISRIFFTVLASRLVITILLFVLLFICSFFIPELQRHFLLYMLGFTFVIGQAFFVNWFFFGIQKMHFITVSSLLSRLIFVVLIFVFIQKKEDEVFFLFFLGAGNLVAALLNIVVAIKLLKLNFFRPLLADIIGELKRGWQVMLSILSLNTYLFTGIFILRYFTSDLVVGYYSIAVRIFFAARQVLAVFSEAVYPYICEITQKGKGVGKIFFKQVYLPFLLMTILAGTLLFIFAPQVIYIFIKDGSETPVQLLRMLSLIPIIVCLNIPAYQLLLAFDRKKSYLRIFSFATVINISANFFLVHEWGATGTVLSIIITELFITAGLNWELYKNNMAGFINFEAM